ncbi:MAG: hypothetical protein P4N41_16980 [Negativicutes bacterium]|nr:hypothetical protein [Negativicutes bacterium]
MKDLWGRLSHLHHRENANDKFSENVNLVIVDLTAYPGMSLDTLVEGNLAQLPNLITDYKLIAREHRMVAGMEAKVLIYTGRQGIFQLKFLQVYSIAGGRNYIITFTAEEALYKKYEPAVREIINSFGIK